MIQSLNRRRDAGPGIRGLAAGLFMAICVAWLYRHQLMNGFTLLAGDRYDGAISTTILEHWYNVMRGKSNWLEVNYFFPHTRSLANTDGYFIVSLIYIPFRLLGFDPFYSAELANMAIKAIGYTGMYMMCRRVFSLPFQWAVLAAILFTLSNGMTVHSYRSQLATVALTPFMVILLWHAGCAMKNHASSRGRLFGGLAGILFGAWCLTCFYAAWFFLYFLIVFAVIALICSGNTGLQYVKEQASRHAGSYLVVWVIALLALGPFLYAFLPKSQETGVRSYAASLEHTVPPENILQMGTENFFVGKIYNKILLKFEPNYQPSNEYYNTGFGILLFGLFILGSTHIYRNERKGGTKLIFSLMLATVLTWLTTLNFSGYSLWYAVFYGIPGAKALRVVSAYNVFLALPIIVISVRYLAARRLSVTVSVVLTTLLILEELNAPTLGLVRTAELDRIKLSQMPPATCKAFYTSGWNDQSALPAPAEIYAHNVTAMLIAQEVNIPTVNGFASFFAPDWDFANPDKADYDVRVRSYASKNGVKELCRLDLNDKTWEVVDPATIRTLPIDLAVFEKSAWDGGVAKFSGLSGQEPWGRWSEGKFIQIEFTDPLPPKFELHVTGHAFSVNADKEFVVVLHEAKIETIAPMGTMQKFSVPGDKDAERVMRFDNPSRLRFMTVIVPRPIAPMELGGSADDRLLGIGLVKFSIVPL